MQINHYFEDGKETVLGLLSDEDIFKCQKGKNNTWKIVMSRTEPFDIQKAAEIINCKVSVLAVIDKLEESHDNKQTPDPSVA